MFVGINVSGAGLDVADGASPPANASNTQTAARKRPMVMVVAVARVPWIIPDPFPGGGMPWAPNQGAPCAGGRLTRIPAASAF